MENLLVKLMLLAALTQLGISVSKFANCRGRACVQMFDRAARCFAGGMEADFGLAGGGEEV